MFCLFARASNGQVGREPRFTGVLLFLQLEPAKKLPTKEAWTRMWWRNASHTHMSWLSQHDNGAMCPTAGLCIAPIGSIATRHKTTRMVWHELARLAYIKLSVCNCIHAMPILNFQCAISFWASLRRCAVDRTCSRILNFHHLRNETEAGVVAKGYLCYLGLKSVSICCENTWWQCYWRSMCVEFENVWQAVHMYLRKTL